MKKFKTVFNFEFKTISRNKSLIVSTIILSVISLIVTSLPFIIDIFSKDKVDDGVNEPVDTVNFEDDYFIIEDQANLNVYLTLFDIKSEQILKSETDMNDAISKNKDSYGYIINNLRTAQIVSNSSSYGTEKTFKFENLMNETYLKQKYEALGIDYNTIQEVQNNDLKLDYISLGKDGLQGIVFSYVILFTMYMLILLYGTNVATSVAREKDSRTMELLITSTKPRTLILGKVAAAGLMGVIQVLTVLAFAGLGVLISKNYYPPELLAMIFGQLSLDLIFVYAIFSVSGYLLYLFIYASMGSLVSKVEDVSKAVAPITYVFIIAYLAATMAMQFPNNNIIVLSSYIPFVSLFTMPIRYMLSNVTLLEVAISMALMLVVTYALAQLSIYIYRFGSLNYGNKLKIKDVFKSIRNKD